MYTLFSSTTSPPPSFIAAGALRVYIYTYIFICTCTCIGICMYCFQMPVVPLPASLSRVCTSRIHACIHSFMYVYICTYIYTYIYM